MAYATMATHYFAQHPAEFLAENYVRTGAVHQLTVTRVPQAGAPLVQNFFPAGSHVLTAPAMPIANSDLLIWTQIAGRTSPTAFIGLDKVGANEYMAIWRTTPTQTTRAKSTSARSSPENKPGRNHEERSDHLCRQSLAGRPPHQHVPMDR